MPEPDPIPSPWRHLRFRLSLRVLMLVIVAVGGWLGWVAHRARVQREVVATIVGAGGRVEYDWQWRYKREKRTLWSPRWLVDWVGIDFFSSVSSINFYKTNLDPDEVAGVVARLGRVDGLVFNGSSLTDAGLARLADLEVRMLYLEGTKVTDAGLEVLGGMTSLEALDLYATRVGNDGVARLGSLRGLQWLSLGQTKVGDPAIEHLEKLRNLRTLFLFHTNIGDAGASRLKSLPNLKKLSLDVTPCFHGGP